MQKQFPAKTACIPRITITTAKQHFNHVFRFCRFALPRYQRSRRQQIHSAYSSSKPKSFRPKSSRVKAYYTKGLTRLFAGRSVLRFLSVLPHGRHIGNGNACCLLTIRLHTDHVPRIDFTYRYFRTFLTGFLIYLGLCKMCDRLFCLQFVQCQIIGRQKILHKHFNFFHIHIMQCFFRCFVCRLKFLIAGI